MVGGMSDLQPLRVRRVVTGVDENGAACVLGDAVVDDAMTLPNISGWTLVNVWNESASPEVPLIADDLARVYPLGVPPQGAIQLTLLQLPPESVGENPAGMHQTDSVDLIIVLAGAVTLVVGEGGEVELAAGDVLVQGGNLHHWANRSDAPCTLAIAMTGAARLSRS